MIPYTPEQQAIRQWLAKPYPLMSGPCGCIGAQDGKPACPCDMQFIERVDNFYYKVQEFRCPDGVTHSAELFGEVCEQLTWEEKLKLDIKKQIKGINDAQGFAPAIKAYRETMFNRFGIGVPLKTAVEYVREL